MNMIGERLKDIRKDAGDRQEDLAQKLQVSLSTVKSWEGEKSAPSHELLVRICRLYGVTSDYLLGLSEEDPLLIKKRREQFTAEDKKVLRLFEEFLIFKKAQKQ